MMTRRETLAALSSPLLAQTPARRPNVVLIMTDDQGYGDLSCHGNPYLKTPNLDALAGEGVEFTRFTVCPFCAPTRSSLMTGRYHLRTGVHGVTAGREAMRPEEVTLGRHLQKAGYRTAIVGKWHLGENYPYAPHARGFDEFTGFRTGHWNLYFDSPTERNGKPDRYRGYVTDALTNEGISFIERNRANPFFLYLAYNAPHSPYQLPQELFDKYRKFDIPPEAAAVYGMVENIDTNIGRLRSRLKALGLDSNTLLIFLTDNGPQTDRFNSGLRARKGSVYEGGTRVPFFIHLPGTTEPGRKVDRIAAHIDVVPTVLELCGVSATGPELDGRSLKPLLKPGAEKSWEDRKIYTHFEPAANPSGLYPASVRTQRWKMVNGKELYDLEADPGESKDLAAAEPRILASLKDDYESWFHRVATPRSFARPPVPVGYFEENPARIFAPQATLTGGARFQHRNGFAHDWVVDLGSASWDIDVHAAGEYEVALRCLAPKGASAEVVTAAGKLEAAVPPAKNMKPIPLPDAVARTVEPREMHWETHVIGKMKLAAGAQSVVVRGEGLQLKEVLLRRLA